MQPKLLVLDMSFTLEVIRARQLEESVTCRDLDGFFSHVWTAHPFATLLTSAAWTPRFGLAVWHKVSGRHTFIEGKVGRVAWLRWFPALNFLVAQIGLFFRLARLIRRERISVIRVGDPHYLGLFGLALSRLCRIPLAIRVGGNYDANRRVSGKPIQPRLFRSVRLEKLVERFVFKRSDLVAGANQDNLDYAIRNGAKREFSTLFRYGNLIDRRHFVDPASRPVHSERFAELAIEPYRFLLTVARLEAVNALKHPEDVVQILARVRLRGYDVKAVLAGEGRLRDALMALARQLDVADHLVLAGARDQSWLAEMYPRAAAMVAPHAGRALSEAALAGTPVAAYDIDWQRELIETDVTGILVPHRDVEALTEAVVKLLGDPAYARKMGDALRRRALDMLDPAALNEHERQTYLKLLSTAGAASEPSRFNGIHEQ